MDISVVIPTYNRKKILEITLPNILNQDFEGEYEIIVSDDGSEDETSSYIKELHKPCAIT
ncbi:MAG: glycosyltransferase family 2 protein [Dictyoglomus turgidum]